jgi:hypothetical protein
MKKGVREMNKGGTKVFITLGLLGFLFFRPFSGYGADLSIANIITGNGNMTLNGTMTATSFGGNGAGLTNLDPTRLSSGTANISISGNAATATTANSVAPGAIAAAELAPGAVTAAKIAFYDNVAVVAKSGGDYTLPTDAMNSLAGWCPNPTYSSPCLVKIMPGLYYIGANSVQMQPYVDIEGSGENTTVITGHADNPNSGTINGSSNAEIRFLTAQNTGGGNVAIAIDNINSNASPKITNVTAIASGATNNIGINIYQASPIFANVTAKAEAPGGTYNYGVVNNTVNSASSTTLIQNVTAIASGGTYNNGVYNLNSPSVIMRNVDAKASGGTISNGVFNDHSNVVMEYVSASASDGAANNGVMNLVSGPSMRYMIATASGGANSNGVFNQDSANQNIPFLYYVTASAHDATGVSNGIRNLNSTLAMHFCHASAIGSITSVKNGVFNDGSSLTVSSTRILAREQGTVCTGGCFGVYNTTSGTVTIDLSVVTAFTNTIYNNNNVTTNIGYTRLQGSSVSNGGTLKCIGTYNTNYDALNGSCQ